MKKKASRQISVRFNRRLIWRKSGQFKWRLTDNRDQGRRSEIGVAESRIQHGQILHIEAANRIKRRISSRKRQKKVFFLSFTLDKKQK